MEKTGNIEKINKLQSTFDNNYTACSLTKKQMVNEDFELIQSWCIKEGWNIGKHDSMLYQQIDPKGHFLFFNKQHVVGSMSLVKHDHQLFTVGPFIVRDSERSKGYGAQIWQQVITRLTYYPEATVLLYAVRKQIPRYQDEGFKSYQNHLRWVINTSHFSFEQHKHIPHPITSKSLDAIAEYDRKIFGFCRKNTLTHALSAPSIKGYMIKLDNHIEGYGLIRPCIHGHRIGPLYANSLDIAKQLLLKLLEVSGGESVIIDMPEMNTLGQTLMQSINAKRDTLCDTVMMIKGNLPSEYEFNIFKNYGLFSLEIG